MADTKSVLAKIQRYQRTWNRGANFLQFLHALMGILAVGASLMVATFTTELGDFNTRILAFTSALAFGVVNSFNLGEKANNFRRACRRLNVELMNVQAGITSEKELIEAYKEAEDIIGDWRFVPPCKE